MVPFKGEPITFEPYLRECTRIHALFVLLRMYIHETYASPDSRINSAREGIQ
jgi:hypothetical protein